MPKEIGGFLKDFMTMRKNLHQQRPEIVNALGPIPAVKKTKGTSDAVVENLMEISLAKIIEDKPKKKDVKEYFQKVCDRLTTEKMK